MPASNIVLILAVDTLPSEDSGSRDTDSSLRAKTSGGAAVHMVQAWMIKASILAIFSTVIGHALGQ